VKGVRLHWQLVVKQFKTDLSNQLAINGNRGTQQEISVSTNVSKEIVPFQHEFPT